MTRIDPKHIISLGMVRRANTRLMSRAADSGRSAVPSALPPVILSSEAIERAGRIAFASLRRR